MQSKVVTLLGLTCLLASFAFAEQESASAEVTAEKASQGEVVLKYGIFREDCYDAFFVKNDFGNSECIKFSFSKLIGILIISGAFILKVPQIISILKAGSTKGLVPFSQYAETLSFLHILGASRHLDLPISVYGETAVIIVQNIIIILLIYHYDKTVSFVEKVFFLGFFAGYGFVLLQDQHVPEEAWNVLSGSNIILNLLSRVPIIWSNFSNKSTGVLAFATFFLGWAGSVARTATVFIESDDPMYLLQFIVSLFNNTVIQVQFLLYWGSDSKADKKVQDTKKTQ